MTAVGIRGRTPWTSGLATRGGRLALSLDPFRKMLFILTIVTISRVHQHFHPIAMLRPALLMTAGLGVYAFLRPKALNPDGAFRTWPGRLVAAFAIFACISAPFGISLGNSGFFILETYSKTVVYCFLLILAVRTTADLATMVWSYVISSAILCWLSLFVFKMTTYKGYQRLGDLYTYDANDIGCVLIVGLALTLLCFQTTGKRGRLIAGTTIVGIGAAMARSGSRGGFLALVVVGAVLLVMLHGVSLVKRMGFVFAVIMGLAIWAPEGYWTQMNTLTSPKEDYNWTSKDGRKEVAKRGIDYMLSYPIFGLGMENFNKAECQISEKAQQHVAGTGIRCTAPHNSVVQAGSELGIPGLAMWLMLTIGGAVSMFVLRARLPKSWAKGTEEQQFLHLASMYFGVAMIGFTVASFFVSFAWADVAYFMAALMSGLYVCVRREMMRGAAPAVATAAPAAGRRPRRRGDLVRPNFITPPAS
jgi:O-antigen ligase